MNGYEYLLYLDQENGLNPDFRVDILDYQLTNKAGFYLPTAEGPRPLYGYWDLFFGGSWLRAGNNLMNERKKIVYYLGNETSKPMLILDDFTAYMQCELFKSGYTCNQPFKRINYWHTRIYTQADDSIIVAVAKPDYIVNWLSTELKEGNQTFIIHSKNASFINNLKARFPDLQCVGPYSAIFLKD